MQILFLFLRKDSAYKQQRQSDVNVYVMTRYADVFKGNLINSGYLRSPLHLLYLRIGQ